MTEVGTILAIADGVATIEVERRDESECARCGLCRVGKDESLRFDVQAPDGAAVGQRVQVEVDLPSRLRSIGLGFVLPLVGLILGAMLGRLAPSLSPSLAGKEDLLSAVAGFGLAAAALLAAHLYDRRVRARGAGRCVVVQCLDAESG